MKGKITMTENELADIKKEWYRRGKRQARQELRTELANVLGLFDLFETKDNN